MKTSKNLNPKNSFAAVAFMLVAFLFLGSCTKDELAQPVQNPAQYSPSIEARQIAPLPNPKVFTMIKIEHLVARFGARNKMPDYSVMVRSDGTVTFEGRNNVAVQAKFEFVVNSETIISLNELFLSARFFNIIDDLPDNEQLNRTLTTFSTSPVSRTKTLVDYNKGFPRELIQLRMKAEEILHISQYVIPVPRASPDSQIDNGK